MLYGRNLLLLKRDVQYNSLFIISLKYVTEYYYYLRLKKDAVDIQYDGYFKNGLINFIIF